MWDLLQSWPVVTVASAFVPLAVGAWVARRKMLAFFKRAGLTEGDTFVRDTPECKFDPGRIVRTRGNYMAGLMYHPTPEKEPKVRVMHARRTAFLTGSNGFISTYAITDPEDMQELRALGISSNEIDDIVSRRRVEAA